MVTTLELARALDQGSSFYRVHDIDLIRYDDGSTDVVVHLELPAGRRAGHWRVTLPHAAGEAYIRDPIDLDETVSMLTVALDEWEAGAAKLHAERLT
ncbi:hypothetical protein [Nocardioides speluncae]|uniref:hypothetical protein n=1 Tax=Nocardioides speluncae TaxID=2670337 RepID=UPI000D696252|nr:hypothetical protein [Nocardioides speluncae]